MNVSEVRNQLSLYLGLDDATIDQQIIPHLNTLKSRADLQDYLTGLLGNDTAQASFVRAYAESRFPTAAATPSAQTTPKAAGPTKEAAPPASQVHSKLSQPQPQQKRPQPAPATAQPVRPAPSSSAHINAHAGAVSVNVVPPATTSALREPGPLPPRSGPLQTRPPDGVSDSASAALFKIERSLRYAGGQGKAVACFCQGRQHPISPIVPLCPRCLLVICDLNVPYTSDCPSCQSSLATEAMLGAHISELEIERDTIIRTEIERIRFESDEKERERRAVQFPTLDGMGQYANTQIVTSAMGYASKAGGIDHYKQIDSAYKAAQAEEAAQKERRVLSLDSKTKKAKVTTTKAKQPAASASLPKKQQPSAKDLDDPRTPYVDENDDGVRKESKGKESLQKSVVSLAWPPATSRLVYEARSQGTADLEDDEEDGESVATES